MDNFNNEKLLKDQKSDTLQLTKTVSLSDLSYSSPLTKIRQSNSSPIQSNLPKLYNNLRANDGRDFVSNGNENSSGRNILKKLLNSNKSNEDLSSSENSKQSFLGRRNIVSRNSISVSSVVDDEISTTTIDTDLELNSQLFKSIGQIKIPNIFLTEGMSLLKVSHKSKKRIFLKIDTSDFKFSWKNAFNSASLSPSNSIQRLLSSTAVHSSKSKIHEFSIDDMKTITYQKDASNYREELNVSKEFENQWITIIYLNQKKGKLKSLHIITDTEHDFKKLASVIINLKKLRDDLAKNLFIGLNDIDDVQRGMILEGLEDNDERQVRQFLYFNDILKYSKRLDININYNYLRAIFDQVASEFDSQSSASNKGLNFDQFKKFVSILKKRDDIDDIWNMICGRNKCMTFDVFKKFILGTQHESFSEDYLSKLFNKFCIGEKDYWIPESFNNYLLSKYSPPFKNISRDEHYFQYPLTEYYISSSHNTYLMGRQVAGDSSIEGYIKALQRGCRCVEVDVWDGSTPEEPSNNSTDSEPIVSHGRTFTSIISFRNVIKTIKKYAFITSPYPLIVSLEINCSVDNQLKVVFILKEILGDTLITEPIDDISVLPSPVQLKHKILLKVKKTSPFNNLIVSENGSYVSSTTTTSFSEDNSTGSSRKKSFSIRRKNKGTKITNELSDLGVYLQGLKFRNFSLPESKTYNHCFSLSEKSSNLMLKDDVKRASVDKHNRKYFMRVYPSKIRLKSSNFIPLIYWAHGVQMVATNWQTYDLGQQLNESMFEGVDKKGYVLKSKDLRKPLLKSSMRTNLPSTFKRIRFEIEIISAHQLPKSKGSNLAINPFIVFEIIGSSDIEWDTNSLTRRTSIISENGFNPKWNEKFSGVITALNDLVFIRLLINSSSSSIEEDEVNTIGIFVAKLSYLNRGYRYFPITDLLGEELIYSSLFLNLNYHEV